MTVLIVILCAICFYDYQRQKIPNFLVVCIVIAGLGRNACHEGFFGAGEYLIVGAVVVLLLYPLFRIGGLGAGDVKLMGACAGFFPGDKILTFLFISLLISAIFSIIRLFRERNARERAKYFCNYCMAVARKGRWSLYRPTAEDKAIRGICMSGPILCSVLLKLGGVY